MGSNSHSRVRSILAKAVQPTAQTPHTQADLRAAVSNPSEAETKQEQTFCERILQAHFVRFHMGLILTSVVASGVLGSRLLLYLGIHSMKLRYPLAVLISYGIFLLLVRIWIWRITCAKLALDLNLLDTPSSGGGSGWGFSSGSGGGSTSGGVKFGGGSSGGGGASDSWGEAGARGFVSSGGSPAAQPMPITTSASRGSSTSSVRAGGTSGGRSGGKSGSWFSDLGIGDGDDFWILLLLAFLVAAILGAGSYLIYAAPHILPEAAWQAALAGSLHRMTKRRPDWKMGVMRSSAIPFVVVLLMAGVLGWQAQLHCPVASRLLEALDCPAVLPTP